MEPRNIAFKRLRPVCVGLNQAVLSSPRTSASVLEHLQQLRTTLDHVPHRSLDHSLAEYVFVPLANVLRLTQSLPLEASEITFNCLAILLRDGWQDRVTGPLAAQLLILLTITADKSRHDSSRSESSTTTTAVSNTLLEAVMSCLEHLFLHLGSTEAGRSQLLESATASHLSRSVVIVLDTLVSSEEMATQISAQKALNALVRALRHDRKTLSSFLPGIFSSLTKVLTPSTQQRRTWKVLCGCMQTLRLLLLSTVSNDAVAGIRRPQSDKTIHSNESLARTLIGQQRLTKDNDKDANETISSDAVSPNSVDASWLEATAGQLKLGLANINRLHNHDRQAVRVELFALDLALLRDCSETLQNCRQMCLEILTVLSHDDTIQTSRSELQHVIKADLTLTNALQMTLRGWTMSLPRILEGSDEDKKDRRLKHIFNAYNTLLNSDVDMRSAQALVADELPGCIAIILRSTKPKGNSITEAPAIRMEELPLALQSRGSTVFPNALSSTKHHATLLQTLQQQLQHLSTAECLEHFAQSFGAMVRSTDDILQVSALYLALASLRTTSDADMLFNLDTSHWREELLGDLYDLSSSVITSPSSYDAGVVLLSLEVIALQSSSLGSDFRPELLDVLYPVLSFLASPNPGLRTHAITCLNIIAESCEYSSVRDLVVENADYITNSIALKLNAFEIDPEAPQVLSMAVELAGADLVPYLGDTVDSIFAILDDYHGYERLVELLFGALKAISKQGAKEPRLMLVQSEVKNGTEMESSRKPAAGVTKLAQLLSERKAKRELPTSREPEPTDLNHPEIEEPTEDPDVPPVSQSTTVPIPAPQTYPLLLRIATLTQHYLPSTSSSLRSSLLALLRDLVPALARHEDSFLPLINTLWPSIAARLRDDEPFVIKGTLDVIELLAKEAGSFMSGRMRDVWPELVRVGRKVKGEMQGGKEEGKKGVGGRTVRNGTGVVDIHRPTSAGAGAGRNEVAYVDPGAKGVWDALRALLITAVRDVGVSDDMFDDVLRFVMPVDRLGAEERRVLVHANAGAVWLARYEADRAVLVVPERIRATAESYRWAGVAA